MRKVIILFLCFVSVFVLAFTVKQNVKATVATDSNIVIEGASIRLSGNQGMRFTGSIGSYSGGTVTKYGICLVSGNVAISDDFVIGGTVGGKSVINAEVDELDGDDNFHVVLWNIPAGAYTMDISARAYVRLDDDSVVYGTEKQARNVWTVAAKAKSAGYSSDLIDDVTDAISSNYMVKTVTSTNQFVLSNVSEDNYTYKDETTLEAMLADLWAEFIADYNAATGTSLVAGTVTSDAFWAAMYDGIGSTSLLTLPSDCNAVVFFSGVNMVKWGWLLEFFTTHGTIHVNNQAEALLRMDRTCQRVSGVTRLPCHQLKHLTGAIWNLFHKSYIQVNGMDNYDMSTYSKYASVTFPTVTDINGSDVVKVGSNVTIPNTLRTGYTLTEYQKLGGGTYDVLDDYEVTTTPAVFTPSYSIDTYSIVYKDGSSNLDLSPSTYTIETATINLPTPVKSGYIFVGWYDNSLLEGDVIASIPLGSHGDVMLYSKWVEEDVITNLAISINDKNALEALTADIIVYSSASGSDGSYNLQYNSSDIGGSYDGKLFKYGEKAFPSISTALTYISANSLTDQNVYVFPGTYSDALSIAASGTTIYGPNYGIYGTASRNTEAAISGIITIAANGVTLDGIKLTGTGKAITWASEISNLTIKNLYSDASGKSTTGGRTAIIASDAAVNNLVVDGIKITCNATAGRDGIAIYGTVTGLEVTNSEIRNSCTSYTNSEVIRINKVAGVIKIENNNFVWSTANMSVFLGSGSNYCTKITFCNNIVTGTDTGDGRTTSVAFYYLESTCETKIIGNMFDYFDGGTTLLFTGSNASATIDIKYNYFGEHVSFKKGNVAVQNYSGNFYAAAQTTATSDYGVITNLAGLISAYKASDEYTTYGSICVYDD